MGKACRYWLVSLLIAGLLIVLLYLAARFSLLNPAIANGKPALAMLAICLGTFVSEDLSTISAGLLAASGVLNYWQSVIAAFSGILIGDIIIFWMGYHFGRPMLAHRWSRFLVSKRAVDQAQHQFKKNGLWIILVTRFLPGTRSATYFAAGAVHAPVLPFVATFAVAASIWTPFLVGLSYLVGSRLLGFYETYERFALPALLIAGFLMYLFFHYGIPLFTWKGRRRLRGKLMRAARWEFWPVWRVYSIVVLYILLIGIFRYRKPALFTAVNPCMPDGGVLGESKSDILSGLSTAGKELPAWSLINGGTIAERENSFDAAMISLGLDYPVVLKPDQGQRGMGVKVIKARQDAADWFKSVSGKSILQEYVGGNEYGIFYVRKPSCKNGKITSITLKKQLFISGNNKDTVEDLIYSHERAVAMLDTFLERFEDKLDYVPAEGEKIVLGELGTHARGSLFLDGRHLITEALRQRIQHISDSYQGFYFGRFDIKAPDDDALKRGENLRIIELNGVTSEETHMYDPQYGLLYAWKCLCRQWSTAFEIAASNVDSGYESTSVTNFFRNLIRAGRRKE